MKELNDLIELLFNNIPESRELLFLRNSYDSLVKIQENIILEKIIGKIETISKDPMSQINKNNDIQYITKYLDNKKLKPF